jgi:hypothetical protein
MPDQQEEQPVIDLSFLDADPALTDDADWYQPLTPAQVAALLTEAVRSAGDVRRVSRIQVRLARAIRGAPCPCPVLEREAAVQRINQFPGRRAGDPEYEAIASFENVTDAIAVLNPALTAAERVRIGGYSSRRQRTGSARGSSWSSASRTSSATPSTTPRPWKHGTATCKPRSGSGTSSPTSRRP